MQYFVFCGDYFPTNLEKCHFFCHHASFCKVNQTVVWATPLGIYTVDRQLRSAYQMHEERDNALSPPITAVERQRLSCCYHRDDVSSYSVPRICPLSQRSTLAGYQRIVLGIKAVKV